MKIYGLDICPKESSGLCNQIYSLIGGIQHCMYNNISILFINKFLKSINSNRYCNISEIINLNKFNIYLSKYGVFISDINNYNFKIEKAELINETFSKNITEEINNNYYTNNKLHIKKNTYFNINNNDAILQITYSLDNGNFTENYIISKNKLSEDIEYDFKSITFENKLIYEQDEIFIDILRNIPFSETIVKKSLSKNNKLLENKKTDIINTIHLRIEDDMIGHFSEKLKIEKDIIKMKIEKIYIDTIIKYLNKSDLIIVLSYSRENAVLDFLKENNYTYIISNEKEEDREISAIYDLLLGQECNNYYICVWESSFSYSLLFRMDKKVSGIQIYYMDLSKEPEIVSVKY
jgi:hypothetical protein